MNETRNAYLMLTGAMLTFGTIGIFRRYITMSSAALACTRGFLGALVIIIILKAGRKKLREGLNGRDFALIVLSGIVMGANWLLLFEAYNYTTVAMATLCYYMEPTIVILLSPLMFSERLTVKKLTCAAVSIAGMVLVSGVAEGTAVQTGSLKGVLFGLGAACLYATVVIINKKVKTGGVYERTVIQLLSAALMLVPYLMISGNYNNGETTVISVIMILILGIVHTGIAYVMYFASLNRLPAQSVAILSYLDPVSALILSALILHEHMTAYGLAGAVMIIGAALVSEMKTRN
ncbi:MAG: DMT family transporter [Clostridia bacterium]|nr:DMT family transporter [Clostridia bacterium]